MQTTYAQNNAIVQKASVNTAESVVDSSSQSAILQRQASLADGVTQRAPEPRPNLTGMPDDLKSGIESLSGFSMDDVRVHYNSSKPATVQALAYTQGTDIHVAPGQEKCLPHEAWHVAQQMAGRVSPTTNVNGMPVNDNAALEREADVMGEKALMQRKNNNVPILRKMLSNSVRQNKKTYLKNIRDLVNKFKSRTYKIKYRRKEGCFDVVYDPNSSLLVVHLPVYFNNGFSEKEKVFFESNVEETWSLKHEIIFKSARLNQGTSTDDEWKNGLGNVSVIVRVDRVDNAKNAYFKLQKISPKVQSHVCSDGNTYLRENCFQTGASGNGTSMPSKNPIAHEAGHMFGLDDEYGEGLKYANHRSLTARALYKTGTTENKDNLTEKALCEKYATKYTVQTGFELGDKLGLGTSVMRQGINVQVHHYATFWDALVKAIKKEYGQNASSIAPNEHEDWGLPLPDKFCLDK